jgi:hypothetical protein
MDRTMTPSPHKNKEFRQFQDDSLQTSQAIETGYKLAVLVNTQAFLYDQTTENEFNLLNKPVLAEAVLKRIVIGSQNVLYTQDSIDQPDLEWRAGEVANNCREGN